MVVNTLIKKLEGKVPFMDVLVAPDKFKGSLSAQDAAAAIAEGWRAGSAASLDREISCRPVADGGEGTAEARRTGASAGRSSA
jgi:glycerate kinase